MVEGEGTEAGNQSRSWEITYWSISREIRAHGKWCKCFEISKPVPSDASPPTRPRLPIIPKQFYQLWIKHSTIWALRDHSHSNHDIICASHPPEDWDHSHCHYWDRLAILTAHRRNRSEGSNKKEWGGKGSGHCLRVTRNIPHTVQMTGQLIPLNHMTRLHQQLDTGHHHKRNFQLVHFPLWNRHLKWYVPSEVTKDIKPAILMNDGFFFCFVLLLY